MGLPEKMVACKLLFEIIWSSYTIIFLHVAYFFFCFDRNPNSYAIPQRASSVLRVVPPVQKENGEEEEDMVEMLYCGDEMVGVKDKFEGGVMGGRDGAIYCIPLRAKSVLRVLLQDPK